MNRLELVPKLDVLHDSKGISCELMLFVMTLTTDAICLHFTVNLSVQKDFAQLLLSQQDQVL